MLRSVVQSRMSTFGSDVRVTLASAGDKENLVCNTAVKRVNSPAPPQKKPSSISSNDAKPFTIGDFEIGERIGKGSTSLVYAVRLKSSGKILAIKTVYKSRLETNQIPYQQLQREIEIQSKFKHPNICRMYSYFHDDTKVYLLLEHCNGGSLLNELCRVGAFCEDVAAKVIRSIASALATMHRFQVAHRDVKTENILIDANTGEYKLADFGCAVANLERNTPMRQTTACGTEEYWASELVEGLPYDESVDNWALGVVLYELLCGSGNTPFAAENVIEVYDRIATMEIDFTTRFTNTHLVNLLHGLLNRNTRTRLRAKQVETHEWITDSVLGELV